MFQKLQHGRTTNTQPAGRPAARRLSPRRSAVIAETAEGSAPCLGWQSFSLPTPPPPPLRPPLSRVSFTHRDVRKNPRLLPKIASPVRPGVMCPCSDDPTGQPCLSLNSTVALAPCLCLSAMLHAGARRVFVQIVLDRDHVAVLHEEQITRQFCDNDEITPCRRRRRRHQQGIREGPLERD